MKKQNATHFLSTLMTLLNPAVITLLIVAALFYGSTILSTPIVSHQEWQSFHDLTALGKGYTLNHPLRLSTLLMLPLSLLTGQQLLWLRLFPLLSSFILFALLLIFTDRHTKNNRMALLTVLFTGLSLSFYPSSRTLDNSLLLCLFQLGWIYLLLQTETILKGKNYWLIGSGLLLGLSLLEGGLWFTLQNMVLVLGWQWQKKEQGIWPLLKAKESLIGFTCILGIWMVAQIIYLALMKNWYLPDYWLQSLISTHTPQWLNGQTPANFIKFTIIALSPACLFWLDKLNPISWLNPQRQSLSFNRESPLFSFLPYWLSISLAFYAFSPEALSYQPILLVLLPLAFLTAARVTRWMEKNSPYLLGSLDTFLILFSLSAIVISYQIFQWLPDRYPILNWPLPGIAMIEDIPLPFLPSIPLWKVWLSLIPITLITSVWCLYFQRQQRHVAPGIYIIFAFWAALIYLHNHLTLPILTIDPRASLTQYLHTLQQAHQPQAIQLRLLQPSPHKPDSALQDVALTLMHKPGFSVLWYSGNLAELPPCPKQTRCIGMFQLESFLEFNVPQKNQWQLFEKTWRQWTPLQDDTLPSEASIIILAEQLPQIP